MRAARAEPMSCIECDVGWKRNTGGDDCWICGKRGVPEYLKKLAAAQEPHEPSMFDA